MKITISSHFDDFFMPPEALNHLSIVKNELQKTFKVKEKKLNQWLSHYGKAEGKYIRAQLALATGELFGLPINTVTKWAISCELIHAASLIHDDICDKDIQRRGIATVWKKFGIPAAVCSGDYLIAESFLKLSEIETGWHQTILLKSLSESVKKITEGQAEDLEANQKKITIKDYEKIAYAKTGPLLGMPLEGMFRCKEISENEIKGLKKLINVMGLVYQMINDYQNILKSKTDIKLNHMNFVNIITKAKNKDHKKMSHEILMEAKKMINKKLQMIEKYIHNVPIIVQPIFMNIAKSMKEGL